VVTVNEGVMTAEPRWRTEVRVEFHTVAECKTCNKTISGADCNQKGMNDFVAKHKSHDLSTSTVPGTNDPRVTKAVEQAIKKESR